jgi:hypothetical protein
MNQMRIEARVLQDASGNYYLQRLGAVDRRSVPPGSRAVLERLLGEADTSGFGGPVSGPSNGLTTVGIIVIGGNSPLLPVLLPPGPSAGQVSLPGW